MDYDINRDLAEDAAEDYSQHGRTRHHFVRGWLWFCDGRALEDSFSCDPDSAFAAGWRAAKDAPDD